MESMTRFYVGLGMLFLLIVGFFVFVVYKMSHSETYEEFKKYDLEFNQCMTQCGTPSVVETQQECEENCKLDYEYRQNS